VISRVLAREHGCVLRDIVSSAFEPDARAAGESERRLHALAVQEETPFFTEREGAALAQGEPRFGVHLDLGCDHGPGCMH
jgi:hypothetical protein